MNNHSLTDPFNAFLKGQEAADAVAYLYGRLAPPLKQLLRIRGLGALDADESAHTAVSDILVIRSLARRSKKLRDFPNRDAIFVYIMTTAFRSIGRQHRRANRVTELTNDPVSEVLTPEQILLRKADLVEADRILRSLITELEPTQRAVLIRAIRGYSQNEIANETGSTIDEIRGQIGRLKMRFPPLSNIITKGRKSMRNPEETTFDKTDLDLLPGSFLRWILWGALDVLEKDLNGENADGGEEMDDA